jgi:hypothetical protein
MNYSEISKRSTNYNPEGYRRTGRPKAAWIDAVDMTKAGVRNCRMEAKDRDGWRIILEDDGGSTYL